ncbi:MULTISPECIES: hypothetical protein [unclassified Variovorax]|uniref:hypothetical protein n=1 Tax=unclassified Variovorax TaxID=663243 RepID=UPI000A5E2ED1|nr:MULTISPECIES: hypothetical protein [unclassified Variovorax]PNG46556.1 hypothetical protein CHC06_06899 [Variovorax sp. B2]PNG47622.1 hypothetical protein CHC07_06788 [Variovorax sp. B4]VTV14322.1 hypothetical protein WDL1CHR_04872 [Variovorax sp. WDL1]
MAFTRRRPSKEELDAWSTDQLDPDNWFRIPEFGVMPQQVGFEGFAFPVVSPGHPNYETAASVRSMLKVARGLIRKDFDRLQDVRSASLAAWDKVDAKASAGPFEIAYDAGDAAPTRQQRERQVAAMLYLCIESGFEMAMRQKEASVRGERIASNAAMLAIWAAGDFLQAATRMTTSDRARLGGLRSGEVRRARGLNKDAVERVARSLGWPEKMHGVNKIVAVRLGSSPARVGQILRELKPPIGEMN